MSRHVLGNPFRPFHHLPFVFLLLSVVSGAGVWAQDAAMTDEPNTPLTVYSARREELVAPILAQFEADTGIDIEVRYGNLAEMVIMILEEGDNSPADVFFAQDAAALGALAREDRLRPLPDALLERVPEAYRSRTGVWVGTSGRARVLIYNPTLVDADTLPDSILDLTDSRWRGLVGWAPTNGPFQGQVTALSVLLGDDAAREWLEGMQANGVVTYPENNAVVQAVVDGEVALGLVNHYYVYEFRAEEPEVTLENHFFADGDPGSLVNVAAAGIVTTSDQPEQAAALIDYLLSPTAQTYFADETYEYPLIDGVELIDGLRPLDALEPPDVDLSDLDDLEGTLTLMREAGVLP